MKRVLAFAAVLTSIAACTGYAPGHLVAGHGIEEVTRQLGAPTGRHTLPQGGTRLEFARGPFGRHTYMVDLDPQSRVTGWRQVLTEAEFATIVPGMSAQELLRRIGRPSHTRGGGWQPGEVWSYRYDAIFCQWFQVSVVGGRVRDASYGPDPLCEVGKDDDRPL